MDQIKDMINSLQVFWVQIVDVLPRIAGAIILFIIGWLIARGIRKVVVRVLKFLRVDVIAEHSGIEGFLLQGGVKYTTVTIISKLVYWMILFAFTLAIMNAIGLEVAAELFNRILLYIPNVFVAILVLIFGTMFARLMKGISYTSLNNIGISGAAVISSIAQYAILIFVVSITLEQLSIGGQILISAFQIAFGALCLALALAFGIGGKEWAADILKKMKK